MLSGLRPYLLLALFSLALVLPGLASVPPLDRDESRFVQATRQMIETDDYVRINFQDQARTKKPVGIHWMQALAVQALGEADAAIWKYRLPSALAAVLTALMVFGFGQSLVGRRAALLGAALTAGSLMLVVEAHQAKTDAVMLACVVAAQGALARFYMPGRARPGIGIALAFWLAQGIGILVKGPVVPMISLLTIISLCVADRSVGWLRGMRPVTGLIVAAAVVAPWMAAITQATGGAFVGEAVKTDLLPKLLGGQEAHGAWPGYYLLLMVATLWPASLFAAPGLARAVRLRTRPELRFLLAWIVPSWIVFELVPTKLPHYVLPLYPAIALLAAAAVVEGAAVLAGRWTRLYYIVWALVGLILAAGMIALPMIYGTGIGGWEIAAASAALAAGLVPTVLARRGRFETAALASLAAAGVLFVAIFQGVMPGLDTLWLSRSVARSLAAHGEAGPVAAVGYHEPSLVFLLGTHTVLSGPGAAARLLAERPGAVAVIAEAEEPGFQAAVKAVDVEPRLIDTVAGFNYSRGKPAVLRLYGAMR